MFKFIIIQASSNKDNDTSLYNLFLLHLHCSIEQVFFKLINLQPSLRGKIKGNVTYIGFYEIYAGLKSTSLNLYNYK